MKGKTKLPKRKSGTILITEDNIINQLYIKSILEEYGYNYVSAHNGMDAISAFQNETSIDLILMDIQIPFVDGLHATRIIREIEAREKKTHRVPIIALTSSYGKEECFKAGCNGYISNPFDSSEFKKALGEYLDSDKTNKAFSCQ